MTIRVRIGTPLREMEAPAPPLPTLRGRPAGFAPLVESVAVEAAARPRRAVERILGIAPIRPAVQALYERALLEEETATLLRRLPADWTVLHSVPTGPAVIPHLLVGPAGVFAVFPQDERDASVWISADLLSVDGVGSQAMAMADEAVGEVEERLVEHLRPGVEIVPVVVFSAPKRVLVRTPPDRVHVLAAADLLPWLRSLPEVCSALIVDRLADAAELPATWGTAADAGEGVRHRQRRESIEGAVADADRRWRRAAKTVAGAGVVVTAASIAALAALVRSLGG
ncbi:hypothetical protein [Naasia aerilata]|uniref:NERD domain-containing protein n=1 Tax=Naasia aerilata TaxID=1162966 RepID=A0ABM8GGZ8_9MICO|nr:hypothetical protein [Naasia aerilata]BDZ47623.1 hypothetical protein GCM10025866_35320 [Naasia aerilata]